MDYSKTTACSNCPFRREGGIRLTLERVIEITQSEGAFPCHKTTETDDEGELVRTGKEVHCAGFLILREKQQQPNQMMRIAERLGMYNAEELMKSKSVCEVFDSVDEMKKANQKCRTKRSKT